MAEGKETILGKRDSGRHEGKRSTLRREMEADYELTSYLQVEPPRRRFKLKFWEKDDEGAETI